MIIHYLEALKKSNPGSVLGFTRDEETMQLLDFFVFPGFMNRVLQCVWPVKGNGRKIFRGHNKQWDSLAKHSVVECKPRTTTSIRNCDSKHQQVCQQHVRRCKKSWMARGIGKDFGYHVLSYLCMSIEVSAARGWQRCAMSRSDSEKQMGFSSVNVC